MKILETTLQKSLEASTNNHDPALVLMDSFNSGSKKGKVSSLEVFGIDRESLLVLGMDKVAQDKMYQSLFIYTDGFFSFLKDLNDEARTRLWHVLFISK